MSKKLMALAAAFALSASVGVAGAQAGGGYYQPKGQYTANNGKSHINQNGNGCRNRCYGDQQFNAGYNNGNYYGSGSGGGYTANNGKSHINQNGNGCRNRCYGDQTFNAGYNNGNKYGSKYGAKGH